MGVYGVSFRCLLTAWGLRLPCKTGRDQEIGRAKRYCVRIREDRPVIVSVTEEFDFPALNRVFRTDHRQLTRLNQLLQDQ